MELPLRELKLNVSYLYRDEESRELVSAEDSDFWEDFSPPRTDRMYECVCGTRVCRASHAGVLALSLFCTLAVAVIIVLIVLFCTIISFSSSVRSAPSNESRAEVLGVVSWLHYPVGELVMKNHSLIHI